MKCLNSHRKPISIFVAIAFTVMMFFWTNQTPAASAAPEPAADSAAAVENSGGENTGFIEQEEAPPVIKRGGKFPWLLVLAGVVVVGAAVYYFTVVNKKYTLTVDVGEGVSGTPASSATKYKKGATVGYSYTLASGYQNLEVTLDGTAVPASGTVTMNGNHTLTVRAAKSYTLTVTKGTGVSGTPAAGTYTYGSGTVVSYSYTASSGYGELSVTLDGAAVPASGTVTMNGNHTLAASASKVYTLTVTKGAHVTGTPNSGSYTHEKGTVVSYSYTPASGYTAVEIKVDGAVKPSAGTITMNADHTLTVTASKTYTLTVTKGAHVVGTPNSGSHAYTSGSSVAYSYAPEAGYSNLQVKLDGAVVANSGTVTMNANHTLAANLSGATIVVNSTPTGARIYMDMADTGFSTPHTFFFSTNVIKNIVLRAPSCGYREWHANTPANVGQTVTLNVTLTPGIREDFGIPASSCWSPYDLGHWSVIGGHYRYKGSASGGVPNCYVHSFSGNYTVSAEMNRMEGSTNGQNAIMLGVDSSYAAYGYLFLYRANGQYGIYECSPYNMVNNSGTTVSIKIGTSAAIHSGLDQWNIMKVVKSGSSYAFYINGVLIHSFTDSTYNPSYVLINFFCQGSTTDVRTDWIDLVPGSSSEVIPISPASSHANEVMNSTMLPEDPPTRK